MKERKTYMIFFVVVFAVNLIVNVYIFSRTRAVFPAGNGVWWVFAVLFWLVAFAYMIGRIIERSGYMTLAEPFVKLGSWWLGAMVYLTLLFLVSDLILLAGDVFDEDLGPVIENNMGDLLKNLQAKQGVFAVLGNHEFYGSATEAHEYLENHNITVLRDSFVLLPNGIAVAGYEDITAEQMYGNPRKPLDELLAGIAPETPVFLLDHQPYQLAKVAEHNVDLQVSGHTHNGQMWPFN
ncbi:MAG: metallophosphoesterase [Mariniphaga sp.]|nr:metallophosphoesterase [Mariniphaga sp.]